MAEKFAPLSKVAIDSGINATDLQEALSSGILKGFKMDGTWYVDTETLADDLEKVANRKFLCSEEELKKILAQKGRTIRELIVELQLPDNSIIRELNKTGGIPRGVYEYIMALPDIPIPNANSKKPIAVEPQRYSYRLDTSTVRKYLAENNCSPGGLATMIGVSKPTIDKALSEGDNFFTDTTANKFISFFGDTIVVGKRPFKTSTDTWILERLKDSPSVEPQSLKPFPGNPTTYFLQTLHKMIENKEVIFRDRNDGRTNGCFAGNSDASFYYLIPKVTFTQVVMRMAADGYSFPIKEHSLFKQMVSEGIVCPANERNRARLDWQVRINGKPERRIKIYRTYIDSPPVGKDGLETVTSDPELRNSYEMIDELSKEIAVLSKTIRHLLKSIDDIKSNMVTKETLMSDDTKKHFGNIAYNASRCGCREAWKEL